MSWNLDVWTDYVHCLDFANQYFRECVWNMEYIGLKVKNCEFHGMKVIGEWLRQSYPVFATKQNVKGPVLLYPPYRRVLIKLVEPEFALVAHTDRFPFIWHSNCFIKKHTVMSNKLPLHWLNNLWLKWPCGWFFPRNNAFGQCIWFYVAIAFIVKPQKFLIVFSN